VEERTIHWGGRGGRRGHTERREGEFRERTEKGRISSEADNVDYGLGRGGKGVRKRGHQEPGKREARPVSINSAALGKSVTKRKLNNEQKKFGEKEKVRKRNERWKGRPSPLHAGIVTWPHRKRVRKDRKENKPGGLA